MIMNRVCCQRRDARFQTGACQTPELKFLWVEAIASLSEPHPFASGRNSGGDFPGADP